MCHSILEWKVTIEITIQHGYFYFTYLHDGDNPCRSVLLCKNSTLVNGSEMPGVCACTKGTGMIISKELFPKETSTCAGETTLSLRDMQERAIPQFVHCSEVLTVILLIPPAPEGTICLPIQHG